jgi:SAM-dependent methyltransferase
MSADSQREAWNRTSAAYQDRHQISTGCVHYGALAPDERALNLLGKVAGLRVLELGCGGGQNCVALARDGADVVGVDVSDEQIAFARRLAYDSGVEVQFEQGNAATLDFLADHDFDLILAVYLFPYIENAAAALAECARLLRPDGRLLISQDHPIRACYWDAENEEEGVLPVRSYFEKRPLQWRFADTGVQMHSYTRSIGQWTELLCKSGFAVCRIHEFPLPQEIAEDPWADEYTREVAVHLPQTILFEAERVMRSA